MSSLKTLTIVDHPRLIIVSMCEGKCIDLWQCVEPLLVTGKVGMVLNLAGTTFLESLSIAAIISTHNKVTATGRDFVVANLEPSIQTVFRILKLNKMFPLDLDLEQATTHILAKKNNGYITDNQHS